jgi:hypothetical protein
VTKGDCVGDPGFNQLIVYGRALARQHADGDLGPITVQRLTEHPISWAQDGDPIPSGGLGLDDIGPIDPRMTIAKTPLASR